MGGDNDNRNKSINQSTVNKTIMVAIDGIKVANLARASYCRSAPPFRSVISRLPLPLLRLFVLRLPRFGRRCVVLPLHLLLPFLDSFGRRIATEAAMARTTVVGLQNKKKCETDLKMLGPERFPGSPPPGTLLTLHCPKMLDGV